MNSLGKIFVGLLGLVGTLAPAAAADAPGAKALRPVTWGMDRPAAAAGEQKVAFAAGAAKALPRQPIPGQLDIVIDVLVAYTGKAAEHYNDIKREVIEPAIEQANHSFRISGIGHVQLRLVHAFQTAYEERSGGHFEHVWRLADKGDVHMARIHAVREQYRADVAILMVDDASGCGLATRVGADADEAFAVVHHECAAKNYTLPHEIGHLIGARHDFAYVSGTSWRDIMSTKDACGGCPRMPVWSNPLVLIGGQPAGTTDLNNARIIAENAWRVAAFR